MKNKTYIVISILIALLIVFIYSHWNLSSNTLKIGSILILTGDGASWGEAARNGIDMAIEEININGGINGKKVEIIHENDGNSPPKALSAFKKLTELNGVKFIIGTTWTNTGLPLIEEIKKKGVLVISPSLGVAEFNESSEYIFNTYPHDYILSEKLAEFVYGKGITRVVLYSAKDPWVEAQSQSFTKKYEQLGGKVMLRIEPTTDTTDVRGDLIKIKENKDIQAVVMTTDGYSLTHIGARQMKELDINLPIYSITLDNKIIRDCGYACENLEFLSFLTPTNEFSQKYYKKYSRDVEIGADSAYDAIMLIAEAMHRTDSEDPDDVQKYINSLPSYSGSSGNLVSDGRGGFVKEYKVQKIKNGVPINIQ